MHHIGLKTSRLDEMIEWYRVVCGMTVRRRWPASAMLSNDGGNHRIALNAYGAADDPDRLIHAGLHHFALEYPSLGDLLANFVRLRELGILPHMTVNHGPTTAFYYVDPDGTSVELQADNFGDWAASSDFIASSEAFAANSLGTFVDPELLIDAWASGMPLDELNRRAYAGEFPPAREQDLRLPPLPGLEPRDLLRRGYRDGKLPGEP
jgi:catechol-2,3-dioxygenase